MDILFDHAAVDLHIHPVRAKQLDGPHGLFIALKAAELSIGLFAGPIQRDVDPAGTMRAKEGRPLLIDQRAVGVDRQDHAQLLQLQI